MESFVYNVSNDVVFNNAVTGYRYEELKHNAHRHEFFERMRSTLPFNPNKITNITEVLFWLESCFTDYEFIYSELPGSITLFPSYHDTIHHVQPIHDGKAHIIMIDRQTENIYGDIYLSNMIGICGVSIQALEQSYKLYDDTYHSLYFSIRNFIKEHLDNCSK